MRASINDDFLLDTETARRIYHDVAEKLPILDYHCHVSPREIAENRVFHNITQLWLEGDHYKWRLMRANGVAERLVTGDAPDEEKFFAWAATLERAAGNPIYHWCHLELSRYMDWHEYLTAANAKDAWEHCRRKIGDGLSVREILKKSNVTLLCTTDDPADSLEWHDALARDGSLETKVLPAFRPDKAVNIEKENFVSYIDKLAASAGVRAESWAGLLETLERRMDFFNARGCVIADHALANIRFIPAEAEALDMIFKKRLAGGLLTERELWQYKTALLLFFARGYHRRGWCMQMHFAAMRDNNSRMYRRLGPDTGYDSVGPSVCLPELAAFMDALESTGELPKMILYSLNPNDNTGLVSLMGCFQGEETAGKMQHGSAWWFNDWKDGMETQIKNLAAGGLLGNFIGMLTDSRSFLSYTRHEYFRRILCGIIGRWVEAGELSDDEEMLHRLVADISYRNAAAYFGFGRYHLRGAELS